MSAQASKQAKGLRDFENRMFQNFLACIEYVKNSNITLSATAYNVVTLEIYGVWVKSKGQVL
jgi:hypothetical protein